MTGVLFLGLAFFCPLLAGAAGGVFLTGVGLAGCLGVGAAFVGFFLVAASFFFTGEESAELELVLEALVRPPFFWTEGLGAEACELSESELLLESLSEEEEDEDEDESLLLLLLLELDSSVVLAWKN